MKFYNTVFWVCLLFFFRLPITVFAQETEAVPEIDVEAKRGRITNEEPEELLGFSLGDSDVSLFITGFWNGTLQFNPGFSISPLGTAFASPETPLLYTQEVDISLSLWMNNRWFVEANFLDDSHLNTYRAGYQGLEGEFVQYAGVGNTGLDFPSFPYLDLGGDSPSSFGFYGRVGGESLTVHTLFRYDAASREEKVFYGGRERTYSYVEPRNSIRGISFVLPDENIDSEITVYIEDEKGAVLDNGRRRWRLALPSEYAAGKTQGLLELNVRPDGMVAVVYSKGGSAQPWLASMGNYNSAGSGFLSDVQQWFAGAGIDLENYPQCGNGRGVSARPGEVTIGGNSALVIYEPGTFSPFERRNRYDAPSSVSEEAALVTFSGNSIQGFDLLPLDTSMASADIPLYAAAVSQRNVYELLTDKRGTGSRAPETCWPLAADYPEIYLPASPSFTGDVTLRFTNYGGTGGFFIGTDVVPGSIQVWRSGIQFTDFNYNVSGGEVNLFGPVGQNELIRITYLKRSEETRLGSIAAGVGAVYHRDASPFTAQAAVGVRWNLTEDAGFTEEDSASQGNAGISAKTAWDYDHLKAHITAGLAFEQTDTTGLYRAAGMEGNEIILSLPPETSFISHPPTLLSGLDITNRAGLTYRNYIDNGVLGSTLMPVEWSGASVVSGQNRPYPVKDSQLGNSQALAAEFTLNDTNNWTGFEVPLGYDAEVISRAGEIEIPYRFYGFNRTSPANFKLIIQIGSLSGKDFAHNENPELVWEKTLFTDDWTLLPPDTGAYYSATAFDQDSRIARFVLRDEDRLKLSDAKYLRVIAVYDGTGDEISGRVLLAPPIVRATAFRPVIYYNNIVRGINDFSSANSVTALETIESGANTLESTYRDLIKRLHPTAETQRVLQIDWKGMETGIAAGVDGRIGALPLADYRELSFFVKGSAITYGTLVFIAADGPDSLTKPQLEARIPLSAFRAGQWSKVTIRYRGTDTGISVDGGDIPEAWFRYRPSIQSAETVTGKSGYVAILVKPEATDTLADGGICIDEIILEDPSMVYRLNAGGAVQYSREGTLVSLGGVEVLSDFSVSTEIESEFRIDPVDQDTEVIAGAVNRTGIEFSLLGAEISGNMAFTAAHDSFLWSADHGISKTAGAFAVKETFYASPHEKNARHSLNLGFSSPFYINFDANAVYEFLRLDRKWNLGMGFKPRNIYIPSIALNSQAAWTDRNERIGENENYGEIWARTWRPMVPDTGRGADARMTLTKITITEGTKPVGAVINLEGRTDFSSANNITRSENSAFLDIPVSLSKTTLNLRAGRGFRKHLYFSGGDALADGEKFFESVNDSLPLWGVFPGYSLFAPKLNAAMDKSLEVSPSFDLVFYTAFNDHFSIRANLPKFYNLSSFIIPSSAGLRLERVLEQKMDTRADLLNLGTSLGFSSINMFGRFGYLPLFNFYQGDEFTHSFETAVIFPRDEDVSWRIQSAVGAGFYGFSGGALNFINTLTLRSGGNLLESFIADWTVPVKKSLLGVFYGWIAGLAASQSSWLSLSSFLNSDYEQLRKESLEFAFDKTDDYLRWNLTIGHEAIIRIFGKLNFSAFIKIRCSEDAKNEVYIFDALLGTSLRVSF